MTSEKKQEAMRNFEEFTRLVSVFGERMAAMDDAKQFAEDTMSTAHLAGESFIASIMPMTDDYTLPLLGMILNSASDTFQDMFNNTMNKLLEEAEADGGNS